MDFGDDQEVGSETNHHQQQQGRKRYHRYTPRQIQALEESFKECPHPDQTERAKLGRELGLEARKVKFWFQNRRTKMKVQHEQQENYLVREENDKVRCQNMAMQEALHNVVCPNCGRSTVAEDYFDEQKLCMENARLKEELAGLTSNSNFLGRPFTQMSVSPLDLSLGGKQD